VEYAIDKALEKRMYDMAEELKSELKGVIGLLKDFKSEALLPVFEAVVNSIQAIEERLGDNFSAGEITVNIIREDNTELPLGDSGRKEPEISAFEIIDNGIGFTEKNWESFKTIASKYKEKKGGKGIGRFTWLKAFDSVSIESVYEENSLRLMRKISFSLTAGLTQQNPKETSKPIRTLVKLSGFKQKYKSSPSACKTGGKISQRIMEHCLFYFISGRIPQITVDDQRYDDKAQKYNLQNIYDDIKNHMTADTVEIASRKFQLYHLKLYGTSASMHNLVLCANSRDVMSIGMSKLLGTSSQFDDNNKKFTYAVYVAGEYLDDRVDASRTEFDIPDTSHPLDADVPIGKDEILQHVAEKAKAFLGDYLKNIENQRKEVAERYVSEKNPALRSVLYYCPEAISEIEPNAQDEKIDEVLYRHKGKAEYEIRKRSEKLLRSQKDSVSEIKDEYSKISQRLDDIQKDNLAAYMIFRKLIIDLLDRKIAMTSAGKFQREDIIHDIFFPRKAITNQINYEDHNLWLLDDRLTFHRFAASDRPLSEIIKDASNDRPDVVSFAEIDKEVGVARSVSIIEFKQPQRNTYDESPTNQMMRMLEQILGNTIHLENSGRPLRVDPHSTRFYCYGLCDFTDKIHLYAKREQYLRLNGELGYFNYHKEYNASLYLIDFEKIVGDAQKRHYAFFEKLGISTAR
jgi:hypothetical protein